MGGDDRVYSKNAEDVIVAVNVTATVLSFCGASFVIWNYYMFENLRTFAFKLIFFVAVGDMINCIGNLMGSPNNEEEKGLCITQALFLQFGDLVSFFWVTSIAWIIHRVLTSEETIDKETAQSWFKWMHLSIWPTALLLSVLPFIGTTYGPSGGFCWIDNSQLGEMWRWISFYVPLWVCIGYMIYIYASVWSQISITANAAKQSNNAANNNNNKPSSLERNPSDFEDPPSEMTGGNNSNHQNHSTTAGVTSANSTSEVIPQRNESDYEITHQSTNNVITESTANVHTASSNGSSGSDRSSVSGGGGSTLNRIKYYPVILFCCYFFSTVRRLAELISGDDAPVSLAILQIGTSSLLGFGNAMAYGLTPLVRDTDKEYFQQLCGTSSGSTQSQIRLTSNDDADDLESEIR